MHLSRPGRVYAVKDLYAWYAPTHPYRIARVGAVRCSVAAVILGCVAPPWAGDTMHRSYVQMGICRIAETRIIHRQDANRVF